MQLLVTGAGGMLGTAAVPILRDAGHAVIDTDIRPETGLLMLDVRNPDEVAYAIFRMEPEVVLHFAAVTSLEDCEADPDNAWHTNALGTAYVTQACRERSIPLLYVSTAGVFDGTSVQPYTEFDTPNPLNVYGRSKLAGERFVAASPLTWIARAGWMMSGGPDHDHKFVSLIVRQVREGKRELRVVGDKYGSPTYGPDFARGICDLIGSDRYGLYHLTCSEQTSRYDIAKEIVRLMGADVEVIGVPSREFELSGFPAARPRNEALRNYRAELEGATPMRGWREALAEYMEMWA